MEYRAKAAIAAPVQDVWNALVSVDKWSEWDPNVKQVDGPAMLGGKLRVYTNQSPTTFPEQVIEFEAPHKMVWQGGFSLWFMTARTFTLTGSEGATTLEVTHVIAGLLAPLLRRFMPDPQPVLDTHVEGLRSYLER